MDFNYIDENIINKFNPTYKKTLEQAQRLANGIDSYLDQNNEITESQNLVLGKANNIINIKNKSYPVQNDITPYNMVRLYKLNGDIFTQNQFCVPYNNLDKLNDDMLKYLRLSKEYDEILKYSNYTIDYTKNELYYKDKLILNDASVLKDDFNNTMYLIDNGLASVSLYKNFDSILVDNLERSLNELDQNVKFSITQIADDKFSLISIVDRKINTERILTRDDIANLLSKTIDKRELSDIDLSNIAINHLRKANINNLFKDLPKNVDTLSTKFSLFNKHNAKYASLALLTLGASIVYGNRLDDEKRAFIKKYHYYNELKKEPRIGVIDSNSFADKLQKGEIEELQKLFMLEKEFTNTNGYDNNMIALAMINSRNDVNRRALTILNNMLDKEYQKDSLEKDLKELQKVQKELADIEKAELENARIVNEKMRQKYEKDRIEKILQEERQELIEKENKKFMGLIVGLASLGVIFSANNIKSPFSIFSKNNSNNDTDDEDKKKEKEESLYTKLKDKHNIIQNIIINTLNENSPLYEYKIKNEKKLDLERFAKLSSLKANIKDLILKLQQAKTECGVMLENTVTNRESNINEFKLNLDLNSIDIVNDSKVDVKEINIKGVNVDTTRNVLEISPNSNIAYQIQNKIETMYPNYNVVDNMVDKRVNVQSYIENEKKIQEEKKVKEQEKTMQYKRVFKM